MSPLPDKLASIPDGQAPDSSIVFGEDRYTSDDIGDNVNAIQSFYDVAQERPSIVKELASWGFLKFDWEVASEAEDAEDLDFPEFGVLNENETHEEWLQRLFEPLVASPSVASNYDLILDPPRLFKINDNLYTEFSTSLGEHDAILVTRDDNGTLRVFIYDPMD